MVARRVAVTEAIETIDKFQIPDSKSQIGNLESGIWNLEFEI